MPEGSSVQEVDIGSKPIALNNHEKPVKITYEELVWNGNGVKVIAPRKPIIPESEGLHFVVGAENEHNTWQKESIRNLLREAYYSLPVARVMSEANSTPDFWANIQLNSTPGADKGVNVIGRNPRSESGWAKPPVPRETLDNSILSNSKKIKELMQRYISLWTKGQISLFSEGINEVKQEADEFSLESNTRNMDILWMNDKYTVDVVKKPHLNGIHIVVSQREAAKETGKIKRPWQVSDNVSEVPPQRQDFLEEFAILVSVQKILWEAGVPYFNPEIQFNGNWTPTMQPNDKGGTLHTANVDTIPEKRMHRQHHDADWSASTHGHLYATDSQDKFVMLPSRPESEVPQEWEGIKPVSGDEIIRLRDVLQKNLTPYLQEHAIVEI